jgi:hypothetical protein
MAVSPSVYRAPLAFLKTILLSSLHLGLNPCHTDQSLTRFVAILQLTLPCSLLYPLNDRTRLNPILICHLFLYDCVGLLVNVQPKQNLDNNTIHLSLVLLSYFNFLEILLNKTSSAFNCDQKEELKLKLYDKFMLIDE